MQIYLAYDGELYDYLEKGNHGDRIRYEPNNQEGIALYEIVLDDNGEKELKEINEENVLLNDQRETNDDLSDIVNDGREDDLTDDDLSDTINDQIEDVLTDASVSEGDIKLVIVEQNSSEDEKKTKKEKKDKKKTKKDKKDKKSKKHKKDKKDKKKTKKDTKKYKKGSHKEKKNK